MPNQKIEEAIKKMCLEGKITQGHAEEIKEILSEFYQSGREDEREDVKNEINNLISEEMNIANQQGQPTSRLTSLMVKML
jgi:hypothetical protein